MRGRPMGRLEHAMGGGGLGGSGGMLGQILGQLGGGPARGGAPAGTGDILGQLSGLSRSLGGGRACCRNPCHADQRLPGRRRHGRRHRWPR